MADEKAAEKAAAKPDDKAAAKPEGGSADTSVLGLLKSATAAALPIIVSAVVSVGFVAFAGKAVLWTRFEALQVPGDQVVKAVPQGEAVATGASMLLIFGALGGLAALGVYLLDRRGRATASMSRGLLVILAAEATVAIWHTQGKPVTSKIVAVEFVVFAVGIIFWSTFVAGLTKERKVPGGESEGRKPEPPCGPFYYVESDDGGCLQKAKEDSPDGPQNGITRGEKTFTPLIAAILAGLAYGIAILARRGAGWACVAALAVIMVVFLVAILRHCLLFARRRKADADAKAKKKKAEEEAAKRKGSLRKMCADLSARCKAKVKAKCGAAKKEEGASEQSGVDLAFPGAVLVLGLAMLVVAVPPILLGEWWLAIALGAVALVGAALWQIASLSKEGFVWYGLAVFISVPLFGTLMLMASNAAEPQVQPMALIRSTDGPDEAIQGLYVTESADRVYFANVATEGCKNEVRKDSGRLLWVPKEEVLAMAVGPLQGVEEAGKAALEMSYDLTPAVETGKTVAVETGGEGAQVEVEGSEEAGAPHDTRLENAGTAVRPFFGAGLRVEPEVVSPGDEATLRMSAPNEAVEGFGASRGGHNLRLGGKVVDIAKERAGTSAPEYIEAESGRLIDLGKEGAYVKEQGEFTLAEEEDDGDADNGGDGQGTYVRLEDPAILEVDESPVGEEPVYVQVEEADGAGQVASSAPEVALAGGTFEGRSWDPESEVKLAGRPLYRQAWHRDHIKFHVPEDARTGVVSVECDQLAGSPLLQVSRAPQARIVVQMQPESARVWFDSTASSVALPGGAAPRGESESGESTTGESSNGGTSAGEGSEGSAATAKPEAAPLTRRWKVDGVQAGHGPTIHQRLAPRMAPYEIELTVIDEDGNSDTAKLQLLRLPAVALQPKLSLRRRQRVRKAMKKARKAIKEAAEAERPKGVEIDGYTDSPGKALGNLKNSLRRDESARKRLLLDFEAEAEASSSEAPEDARDVPVEELAHGESCPIHPHPTRGNLHVDLFLLHEGVIVKPAKGCRPHTEKSATWTPPPGKTTG